MKNKKLLKKIALLSLTSAFAFPLSSCLSMAATLYIQGELEAKENEKKNSFDVEKEGHILFGVMTLSGDGKYQPYNICCTKAGVGKTKILEPTSFVSDTFETYVAGFEDYKYDGSSTDNRQDENRLVSTKVTDKEGNEIEAPEKILPYMKALTSYDNDIISATFLYTERETFAIVTPNVNWVSISDIIGFDAHGIFYYSQGLEEIKDIYAFKFLD